MAVKIRFDESNVPQTPTFVLGTRNGKKIGLIPGVDINFKNSLNSPSTITFAVHKIKNNVSSYIWDNLTDFKLLWCKEWNLWYEIYVETNEENGLVKNISATSLGEAELSQINLYNIEINTENDIEREDYQATVLYNENKPAASLLNRIMEKAPHYKILYVETSIKNIQRTFSFDNKSIYDAFQEIAEEIHCLFQIECKSDDNGNIVRGISVYDLESYCLQCGERGSFLKHCSHCGSENILTGYGHDTGIFITNNNLAESITYTTDNGSVKNCFRLVAGDDLMTATISNCNPNGSAYIWYIPDDIKADMSSELAEKLSEYDTEYEYYQKDYVANISQLELDKYNKLVEKYSPLTDKYKKIEYPITGYPAVMQAYYDTLDFYLYLNNGLMPDINMSKTSAKEEIKKLTRDRLSPVAVQDLSICSSSTADSAVLAMAKIVINTKYRVEIKSSEYSNNSWSGVFTISNYSDSEDSADSEKVYIVINDDYEKYVKQKIDKVLSKSLTDNDTEATNIIELFDLSKIEFQDELKKYSLSRLKNFYDSCQSCLDILVQQGVADENTWLGQEVNLYETMYIPYYEKLSYIESEIKTRETEISIITGVKNSDGTVKTNGLQTYLSNEKENIQNKTDFEKYLGEDLWLEFSAYRRENTFQNDNYISDGLDNAELFKRALEFIEEAKKEIIKSATLQHSISTTLKNLLVMKEFKSLVDQFEVGNWLRIKIDNNVYRLRLLDYEIDYSDLTNVNVTFSDVINAQNDSSDIESILSQSKSISTSYSAVSHQVKQGEKKNKIIDNWVENGLDATNTKIISKSDNQFYTCDSHGMLFQKYDPVLEEIDDCQLKIINSTLAITDNNWKNIRTAVGFYYYFDPETNKLKQAYGVNAETIVGKLILGEQLKIYNSSNNFIVDTDGLTLTNNVNTIKANPNDKKLFVISNENKDLLYLDDEGLLHLDGSGIDLSANEDFGSISSRITQTEDKIQLEVNRATEKEDWLSSSITQRADEIESSVTSQVNNLQSQITQNANKIELKVSSGEFGTLIQQNSENIKIAWNNISKYIQFENGELQIYKDETGESDSLLMRLGYLGNYYYYKGMIVGQIGTNGWAGNENYRGLIFGLRHDAGFMSWGYQEEFDGNYIAKIIYHANDNVNKKGIHLMDTTYYDCETRYNGNVYFNDNVRTARYEDGNAGLYSETHEVSIVGKTAKVKGSGGYFEITDSRYVFGNSPDLIFDCYNNIDLHNYSILNNSDIRLKTNICDTDINALDLLSKIELKSFDWIEDNKHENIGIIAQQLQEIIPDLVHEDKETSKLSIDQIKLIPYIIKAIQELSSITNNNISRKSVMTKQSAVVSNDDVYAKYSLAEKQKFVDLLKSNREVKPQTEEVIEYEPVYI